MFGGIETHCSHKIAAIHCTILNENRADCNGNQGLKVHLSGCELQLMYTNKRTIPVSCATNISGTLHKDEPICCPIIRTNRKEEPWKFTRQSNEVRGSTVDDNNRNSPCLIITQNNYDKLWINFVNMCLPLVVSEPNLFSNVMHKDSIRSA